MNLIEAADYAKASALAMALPLDEPRAQRVAMHLVIACNLARVLDATPMEPGDELAEIYRPAPFPAGEPGAAA